jgi:ataxin-3
MTTFVYHEKQDSRLCGQHCLNNLLQGPHFDAIYLADIASELDGMERRIGAVEGRFTSANVDDTGNFSIQVLRVALQRKINSDLVPWHQKKGIADIDITKQKGIVVNRSEHWFTIRNINNRWWNLNSTIDRPEYISDFALSAFLSSLRAEGYSVFVAEGNIPDQGNPKNFEYLPHKSEGVWYPESELFHSYQVKKPDANNNTPSGFQAFQGKGNKLGGEELSQDKKMVDLVTDDYDEELELAKAISASMQPLNEASTTNTNKKDDLRAKRLAALSKMGIN